MCDEISVSRNIGGDNRNSLTQCLHQGIALSLITTANPKLIQRGDQGSGLFNVPQKVNTVMYPHLFRISFQSPALGAFPGNQQMRVISDTLEEFDGPYCIL